MQYLGFCWINVRQAMDGAIFKKQWQLYDECDHVDTAYTFTL